jgi:hypothetical protein
MLHNMEINVMGIVQGETRLVHDFDCGLKEWVGFCS